ncbi:MAG: cyanophycin synthetase [Pirellulales bacterium]
MIGNEHISIVWQLRRWHSPWELICQQLCENPRGGHLCSRPYGRCGSWSAIPRLFVDRTASPESLAQSLKIVRQTSQGRVICVLGCAGYMAKDLRAAMGRIAERGCDIPIITSDNPGLQSSEAIMHDMLDGFDRPAKARHRHGRREAIRWALSIARPGDTVLVTYNGRLGCQKRDGVAAPFDEVGTLLDLLRQPPAGQGERRFRIVG